MSSSHKRSDKKEPSFKPKFYFPYNHAAPYDVAICDLMLPPSADDAELLVRGDGNLAKVAVPGLFLRLYYPTDKGGGGDEPDKGIVNKGHKSAEPKKVAFDETSKGRGKGDRNDMMQSRTVRWIPRWQYAYAAADVMGDLTHGRLACCLVPCARREFKHYMKTMAIEAKWCGVAAGDDGSPFPLIVVSPGYLAPRFAMSAMACDWAANGFCVAVLEHGDGSQPWTYRIMADGRRTRVILAYDDVTQYVPHERLAHRMDDMRMKVHRRTDEIYAVMQLMHRIKCNDDTLYDELLLGAETNLSQLGARLDLASTILIGHSLGAAAVLHAAAVQMDDKYSHMASAICNNNKRRIIDRVVALDEDEFMINSEMCEKLVNANTPVLLLNAEDNKVKTSYMSLLCREKTHNHTVIMKHAEHGDFCDMNFLMPKKRNKLKPDEFHELVNKLIYDFIQNTAVNWPDKSHVIHTHPGQVHVPPRVK